jgi:L-threonylcarbamoyladenylate synthase
MNRFQLHRVLRVLRAGGVVAYPTEAVFGLGCDPLDGEAVRCLLQLKQRHWSKGLILVAADVAQLHPFILQPDAEGARQLEQAWPGPATFVLPARTGVPSWLTGRHQGLAVRVSAHPLVRALCRAWGGPLVSTSANPGGRPPARTALGVRRYFGTRIPLVVSGRTSGLRKPTPIFDLRTKRLLRS